MFTEGKHYRRRDIHNKYGGQQQGGISTPVKFPVIFLFVGDRGQEYGYIDGWVDNNLFLFTGEGQTGDMRFIRGNKAILNHQTNNEEIYLFKNITNGLVEFLGKFDYEGHDFRRIPDVNDNMRKGIVFRLKYFEP